MIKLYNEDETLFTSLGIGFLDDTLDCIVNRTIEGEYYLTMVYPIKGKLYSELKNDRILFAPVDETGKYQPFRIYHKEENLDGNIDIKANHISYDLINYSTGKITSTNNISEVITKIQNETIPSDRYNFVISVVDASVFEAKGLITTEPINTRGILLGSSNSIVTEYKAEIDFDMYNVTINKHIGSDKGFKIKYAYNMVTLENMIDTQKRYTGIRPYYAKETTSTTSQQIEQLAEAYINRDTSINPLAKNWLVTDKNDTIGIAWNSSEKMYVINEPDNSEYNSLIFGYKQYEGGNPEIYWSSRAVETEGKTAIEAEVNTDGYVDFSKNWLMYRGDTIDPTTFDNDNYYILIKRNAMGNDKYVGLTYKSVGVGRTNEDVWEHKYNSVYIRKDAEPFSPEWFSETKGGPAIDPTNNKYKAPGESGDILYFVVRGTDDPEGAPEYFKKIYEYKTSTNRYAEVGSGIWNTIKGLWNKITKSQAVKGSDYKDIVDMETEKEDTHLGIVYLPGHSYTDKYQKILSLNVSNMVDVKFKDLTVDNIYDACKKYISENKEDLIEPERELKTSFIDLNRTDIVNFENNDNICIGDTVHISYKDLDIDQSERVLSITFDCLKNMITEIEIGEYNKDEEN